MKNMKNMKKALFLLVAAMTNYVLGSTDSGRLKSEKEILEEMLLIEKNLGHDVHDRYLGEIAQNMVDSLMFPDYEKNIELEYKNMFDEIKQSEKNWIENNQNLNNVLQDFDDNLFHDEGRYHSVVNYRQALKDFDDNWLKNNPMDFGLRRDDNQKYYEWSNRHQQALRDFDKQHPFASLSAEDLFVRRYEGQKPIENSLKDRSNLHKNFSTLAVPVVKHGYLYPSDKLSKLWDNPSGVTFLNVLTDPVIGGTIALSALAGLYLYYRNFKKLEDTEFVDNKVEQEIEKIEIQE